LEKSTLTCRAVSPDERASVVRRVEDWNRTNGQLARTHPQVYDPSARADLVGLFDGDQLRSHAAVRSVRLKTAHGPVASWLVGSVVTAPDARSQGLASDLLRHIAELAAANDQDSLLLWSGRWDFYQALGYRPSGSQLEARLASRPGCLAPGIRPAGAGDLPAILALHQRKPLAVERSLQDLALLLSARPMQTMVLERRGELLAYACYGKGLDFADWWHEVGGDDQQVATLVQGAMEILGQQEATLLVPSYRRDLVDLLGRAVLRINDGIAALCKPLREAGRREFFVDGLDSI
jgi:GNAT superfamily N-acetyltransferase